MSRVRTSYTEVMTIGGCTPARACRLWLFLARAIDAGMYGEADLVPITHFLGIEGPTDLSSRTTGASSARWWRRAALRLAHLKVCRRTLVSSRAVF